MAQEENYPKLAELLAEKQRLEQAIKDHKADRVKREKERFRVRSAVIGRVIQEKAPAELRDQVMAFAKANCAERERDLF